MTRISLRVGVFRDRPVFETMLRPENPIVVPAHIAARSPDGIWGFLKGVAQAQSIPNPSFFYDPMSYWFDLPTRYWSSDGKDLPLPITALIEIRPSFVALLRAYGMLDAVQTLSDFSAIRATFVKTGVQLCLDFQRQGSEPKGKKTVNKYAEILRRPLDDTVLKPSRVVAPYFRVSNLDRPGVAEQAQLNSAALKYRQAGETLWTVLALESTSYSGISDGLRTNLQIDEFDGIGLWISDFDEHDASEQSLKNYRSLVESLRLPVWVMYGGYFALLLGPEGVQDVSHGVYYTESKKMRGPIGSGPAPERYYVPALHKFYPPDPAFVLLGLLPSLQCTCSACSGGLQSLVDELRTMTSSPAARMAWAERLQRHFLYCRAAEVQAANGSGRETLAKELKGTANTLESVGRSKLSALDISYGHLQRWAAALGY